MLLTYKHLISIFITLIMVAFAGIYAGRKISSASDFLSGGKNARWHIIAGTIIGTLVGGSATLGTVQMAYVYGLSGWWFTLGAGIGCVILSIFFIGPLRQSKSNTISEILTNAYGPQIGIYSSVFTSIGMFLNVVAQVLSLIALFTGVFRIKPFVAAIIGIFLMATYVIFGGVWGTGIVGIIKTIILYVAMITSGVLAYVNSGGITKIIEFFPTYPWLSLFGRGFLKDIAAGFSVVVGVVSTQTYIQAVVSGNSLKESKIGSLLSAFLIPPIGLAGVSIGLFMKKCYPNLNAAEAFPLFIVKHVNPWLGGILIGALFIAIIGTGAGLTLGISTVLTNDIYNKYINKGAENKKLLFVSRIIIIGILCISLAFVSNSLKSLILEWSFLSMGFRGTAAFIPMITALFFKDKVSSKAATLSVITGPVASILSKIILPTIDPLYVGLATSIITIVIFSNVNSKTYRKSIN